MKGFGKKCHPSLSTSIPPVKPDIMSTFSWGRSMDIAVAN